MHQAGRSPTRPAATLPCWNAPQRRGMLHLFGVLHHQCGHFARAVELIEAAMAYPAGAAYHTNLAEAHAGGSPTRGRRQLPTRSP